MKRAYINGLSTGVVFLLVLSSQLAFGKTINPQTLTCPNYSNLQTIVVTENDLAEIKPPRQTCCTASGFPYIENGEWTLRQMFGTFGTDNTWEISTRTAFGENIEQAVKQIQNNLSKLQEAWLHKSQFGRWECIYGYNSGVSLWLVE